MCLLFVYLGNWVKQSSSSNFYKLILAMNRDERHSVRIVPAKYWKGPDSHILAGHNLKNHSTWLGISKHGKLGAAVRIGRETSAVATAEYVKQRFTEPSRDLISRGTLVPKFLQSWTPATGHRHDCQNSLEVPSNLSGMEFSANLCAGPEHRSKLRTVFPFHLLAVDLLGDPSSKSALTATYLSNLTTTDPNAHTTPRDVTPPLNTCDYLAYGNSPSYKPFQKVLLGRFEFMDIITDHNCTESGAVVANEENKTSLKNSLLEFLQCTKRHLPDPVLHEYAQAARIKLKVMHRLSSRFVTDFYDQGTRVVSILLVDTDNNLSFYEWYSHQPVHDPKKATWKENQHEFKLSQRI